MVDVIWYICHHIQLRPLSNTCSSRKIIIPVTIRLLDHTIDNCAVSRNHVDHRSLSQQPFAWMAGVILVPIRPVTPHPSSCRSKLLLRCHQMARRSATPSWDLSATQSSATQFATSPRPATTKSATTAALAHLARENSTCKRCLGRCQQRILGYDSSADQLSLTAVIKRKSYGTATGRVEIRSNYTLILHVTFLSIAATDFLPRTVDDSAGEIASTLYIQQPIC